MFAAKKQFFTGGGGYEISRSVRLRSSASAYFNRTVGAGNQQKWTWSGWVKFGSFTSGAGVRGMSLLFGTLRTSNYTMIGLNPADSGASYQFGLESVIGTAGGSARLYTTAVLRDPSAWYHLVMAVDTTQATAANRVIIYVNGVSQAITTAFTPAQNLSMYINENALSHGLGAAYTTSYGNFDGCMTEVHFVDGQQLTASSFGETDVLTGVWKPKKYTGTYGTNGFYVNFSDNSAVTATTIGKDYSGNGNNWTPNNISVTAGATYDSMLDVPTPYADGGNGRGNYCVLNSLKIAGVAGAYANANLTTSLTTDGSSFGTIAVSSGKWYWEVTPTVSTGAATTNNVIGVSKIEATASLAGNTTDGFVYRIDGNKYTNSTASAYGAAYALNDVIGVALDMDAGTVTFYKNGTSQGTAFTGLSGNFAPVVGNGNTSTTKTWNANFGQRPFTYTPPTGFQALNTQNLPDATIKNGNQYFDATTYTGNGGTQSIVNSGSMQPDLVWLKNRSAVASHALLDAVRGTNSYLYSDLTNAEGSGESFSSFNSNGFSLSGSNVRQNANSNTYVGWQWNAGGSTVTNTSGSISAQVRANPTAGFSIATFTSTGASATVGHGLGVAPNVLILKSRNNVSGWQVYHSSVGNTGALNLQTTGATSTSIDWWRNTSPTSSVFTIGANFPNTYTWVAYCFAEVAGYSKFGSYTGNGSADGAFVYLGFRPRWVMFKRTDTTSNWLIIDSVRGSYNPDKNRLFPNLSNAEDTSENFDFLSNGFKLRDSAGSMNASGGTYIFAAFAENPFKNSLAR